MRRSLYKSQNPVIMVDSNTIQHYKTPLVEAMLQYKNKRTIPFDVPGHRYGRGAKELVQIFGEKALKLDFNSMKSLDILANPTGVIEEAEKLLANAYGGDHGYFVVNGTSSAVKSMIMAICKPNDKIIVPRNAHKSVLSGLILSGAIPVYLQPAYDENLGVFQGVIVDEVKQIISENQDAKAILLINPTYYGATSDIKKIVALAHEKGIAVIVDEAHGAHLKFHDELPESGMDAGADACAISMHKTGGSLTQSSVIVSKDGLLSASNMRKALNLNGTTSASYLLMGSLDMARKNLVINGRRIFDNVLEMSREARTEINKIPGLYACGKDLIGAPGVYNFDETKLVVNVSKIGLTGFEAYELLRDEYNIQVELGDAYNVLAVISLGDSQYALKKLVEAFKHMAVKYGQKEMKMSPLQKIGTLKLAMSPREAYYKEMISIPMEQAAGLISGESIMAYPPGIPIITPGEVITREVIEYLYYLKANQALITDIEDASLSTIKVIR